MSKIVISGYYGYDNLGDEAILMAMISVFKSIREDIEPVVLSARPDITAKRYGVKAVNRNNLLQIIKEIKDCDLFISGGGSLLQDVTSLRTIPYYLGLLYLAIFLGKETAIFAQGIGPVKRKFYRWLIGKAAGKVSLLAVRDNYSKQMLVKRGIEEEKVFLTVDPVFVLKKIDWQGMKASGNENISLNGHESGRPLIGVAVRNWGDNSYLQPVADSVIEMLKKTEGDLILIPMHSGQDHQISKRLKLIIEDKLGDEEADNFMIDILDDKYGLMAVLKLFEKIDFLLGVRLHSLIFAALHNVPFVAIEYDPKVRGFINSLGINCGITMDDIKDEAMLLRVCNTVWQNRYQFRQILDKKGNIFYKKCIGDVLKLLELTAG